MPLVNMSAEEKSVSNVENDSEKHPGINPAMEHVRVNGKTVSESGDVEDLCNMVSASTLSDETEEQAQEETALCSRKDERHGSGQLNDLEDQLGRITLAEKDTTVLTVSGESPDISGSETAETSTDLKSSKSDRTQSCVSDEPEDQTPGDSDDDEQSQTESTTTLIQRGRVKDKRNSSSKKPYRKENPPPHIPWDQVQGKTRFPDQGTYSPTHMPLPQYQRSNKQPVEDVDPSAYIQTTCGLSGGICFPGNVQDPALNFNPEHLSSDLLEPDIPPGVQDFSTLVLQSGEHGESELLMQIDHYDQPSGHGVDEMNLNLLLGDVGCGSEAPPNYSSALCEITNFSGERSPFQLTGPFNLESVPEESQVEKTESPHSERDKEKIAEIAKDLASCASEFEQNVQWRERRRYSGSSSKSSVSTGVPSPGSGYMSIPTPPSVCSTGSTSGLGPDCSPDNGYISDSPRRPSESDHVDLAFVSLMTNGVSLSASQPPAPNSALANKAKYFQEPVPNTIAQYSGQITNRLPSTTQDCVIPNQAKKKDQENIDIRVQEIYKKLQPIAPHPASPKQDASVTTVVVPVTGKLQIGKQGRCYHI